MVSTMIIIYAKNAQQSVRPVQMLIPALLAILHPLAPSPISTTTGVIRSVRTPTTQTPQKFARNAAQTVSPVEAVLLTAPLAVNPATTHCSHRVNV